MNTDNGLHDQRHFFIRVHLCQSVAFMKIGPFPLFQSAVRSTLASMKSQQLPCGFQVPLSLGLMSIDEKVGAALRAIKE